MRLKFYAPVLLGGSAALHGVHAAGTVDDKIARDLTQVIEAASTPKVSGAKDANGLRMAKVLIVADSPDPDLVTLRGEVIARGGSVDMRYALVRALWAMMRQANPGLTPPLIFGRGRIVFAGGNRVVSSAKDDSALIGEP